MGVTKGRVSQIMQGRSPARTSGPPLGGRLQQSIYFDNGDITTIA
jgi:hypothetical protein